MRISRSVLLASAPFWMALAAVASAGENVWTSHGPGGGDIRSIAIDPVRPATLYLSARGAGAFKSTDGGGSWRALNIGPTSVDVRELAFDPSSPATLYAATSGGVFKTTDGGDAWRAINSGLADGGIGSLAIDPSAPGTLYALVGGHPFKSTDGGESWNRIGTSLQQGIRLLRIDPAAPATLYAVACAGACKIAKSTDSGGNWTLISTNLSRGLLWSDLAVDRSMPNTLYAAMIGFDDPGGVFKSTDGGVSWTRTLRTSSAYAVAFDPSDPATIYATAYSPALHKSVNHGGTWVAVASGLPVFAAALAVDPSSPTTLYAGTRYAGVYKSSNAGAAWTPVNSGLGATDVYAVAFDPSAPDTLYAGGPGIGAVRSNDGGKSWTKINSGLWRPDVRALTVDHSARGTIYACTADGPFKSVNSGESWTAANANLPQFGVHALVIDPSSPSILYAATSAGVSKSIDGGSNWMPSGTGLPEDHWFPALTIDPSEPATLYALTSSGGVFKTANGGANWAECPAGYWVSALAVDPSDSSRLYGGTAGGVLRSSDGGRSWELVSLLPTNSWVTALIIDPLAPATLFAGTFGGGVFASTNRGESFTELNAGLTNLSVRTLDLRPSRPAKLVAATSGGGVFDMEIGELPPSGPCVSGQDRLCLLGSRFEAKLIAVNPFTSAAFAAHAAAQNNTFGYFSFPTLTGDATFPEVFVKIIDATSLPGAGHWVFFSSMTSVSFTLRINDTRTGQSNVYRSDGLCGAADVFGFPPILASSIGSDAVRAGTPTAFASTQDLRLLSSRFRIALSVSHPPGPGTVAGTAIPQADRFGYFSLPELTGSSSLPEVFVKMIPATSPPGDSFYFFHSGVTNLPYTIRLIDTVTGAERTYSNDASDPKRLCGGADLVTFE